MASIPPIALGRAFDVQADLANGYAKPGEFFSKGTSPGDMALPDKDLMPNDALFSCRYANVGPTSHIRARRNAHMDCVRA